MSNESRVPAGIPTGGQFATTTKTEAATSLTPAHVRFHVGDELPMFEPGTTIDVDGHRYYAIADFGHSLTWLDGDGEHLPSPIGFYAFTVVPETEMTTVDEDGFGSTVAALVEQGDAIYSDGGDRFGTVSKITPAQPGGTELRFTLTDSATGEEELTVHPGDELSIHRPEERTTYDKDSHDYWANVRAAASRHTDAQALSAILAYESEDDFCMAALRNPNVTSDLVEQASRHHSYWVRRAAVFHEKVSPNTLARIRDEADAEADEYSQLAQTEGVSPSLGHLQYMAAEQQSLARAARQVLTRNRFNPDMRRA